MTSTWKSWRRCVSNRCRWLLIVRYFRATNSTWPKFRRSYSSILSTACLPIKAKSFTRNTNRRTHNPILYNTNMRHYPLLFALLFQLSLAQGQDGQSETGQTFSLEQSIAFALENNILMKNAELDERIADGRVKETRGIGLPQIDASVALRHNQKLQRFFASKQTSFAFSGLPEEQYDTYLPGLADDDVVAAPNFFRLKSSGDAGVTINQLIFNSSYLVGLQAANAYRDLAIKTTDQTREELVQQVAKAYYTCVINKDRITLFNTNIARVDSLLRTTTAL